METEHLIHLKLDRMENGDIRVFVRVDNDEWVERGYFPAGDNIAQLAILNIKTRQ